MSKAIKNKKDKVKKRKLIIQSSMTLKKLKKEN